MKNISDIPCNMCNYLIKIGISFLNDVNFTSSITQYTYVIN